MLKKPGTFNVHQIPQKISQDQYEAEIKRLHGIVIDLGKKFNASETWTERSIQNSTRDVINTIVTGGGGGEGTTAPSVGTHDVLSLTHPDTIANAPIRGDIITAQGTTPSLWARKALGASGTIARSDGADLLYSTATYPNTTTVNQLLYSSAANTITGLATANNGVLVTDGSGVPSIGATLPTAVQDNITRLGTVVSGVWQGTLIGVLYGGTGANLSATGGAGQYVKQATIGGAFTVGTIPASDIASGAALTRVDDTNVTLTLGGSPTTALLATTSLTLGWTGTLAATRLNSNVVQSVVNDTNVTGSIATQALTLGWTGTLAITRGGTGQSTATEAFDALAPTTTLGDVIYHNGTDNVRLAGNTTTTKKFLRQTGDGVASAAPAWDTVLATDIGSGANLSVGNSMQITAGSGTAALLVAATIDTIQDIRTTATPQFARLGLGAAADANHLLLLSSGTITTDKHQIDGAITWNNAGVTFTGWKLNVTNTASAAGSLLMNLQIGGSSKLVLRSDGRVVINGGTATSYQLQVNRAAVGTSDIFALYNDQAQADNNASQTLYFVKGETSGGGSDQPIQIAGMVAGATGVTVADTWLGFLDFYVANTGGAPTKKMRLRGDGQIEIPALTHCLANFGAAGLTSEISHVATGQVLTSAGTTTAPAWSASPTLTGLTLSGLTQGSLLFAGASGVISQDNANLFWDDSANRLGIGTASPGNKLHILNSGGVADILVHSSSSESQILSRASAASQRSVIRLQGSHTGFNGTQVGDGACRLELWGSGEAANPHKYFFVVQPGANLMKLDVVNNGSGGTVNAVMVWKNDGNVKIAGIATRATTEGTNHLDIFDGTAPVGTLANGISLYSTAGELRVMDAAGNPTLLSPHDKNGNWIFDSYVGKGKNRKRIIVDMEKMMRFLNDKFGTDFIHEYMETA